jgi:ABC-type bacteriocin/lantibiotic exporter with double-glycine peptidase domain
MIDKIFDSFSNLANIYINNQNDNQIKSNSETENGYAKLHSSTSLKINNMNALITFIAIIFYIGAVYILYKSKINKSISNIEFITYFIVLSYYIKSTLKLISVINPYITKLAIIKYSEKFIENILSASDDNNKNNSNINNGSIQFNNISFGYKKSNKQIYSRFNLEIKGGEKVALIGSSGSGKSTLMKLLLKLHKLDGGEIYIDNKNIDYMSAKYIRDNCIYINQKTQLFNESVLYNIKYGNDSVDDNYIKSIMQNYEIDVLFKNLEKGLDSICGPNGSNLSLGMQKVIIIMRGILKDNGKIYIFDEPLAGLDINTRKKIIKLIIDKTKHKTLIVITHDTDIIPYLDRTINLNKEMKST